MERVVTVRVVPPYELDLTFDDGTQRRLNLEAELWGEVFEPLRDPAFFAQVRVDSELGTVVWPNGADLSPEFLYYGEEGPPPGYYDPVDLEEEPEEEPAPVGAERHGTG